MDPAQGRGWAVLDGDRLKGMIFFHQGDESEFDGGTGSRRGGLTVADEEKLKLGKGAAFVKGRLKRLPQGDETWEADFQALPKPIDADRDPLPRDGRHGEGRLAPGRLAVHGRPSVNDLATLLAHAMRRPLDGDARRPKLVRLRGHHQWRELFPHLEEIGVGVEVSVGRSLPGIEEAYGDHLRRLRDEQQGRDGRADAPSRRRSRRCSRPSPGRSEATATSRSATRRVSGSSSGRWLRRARLRGRHAPTRWPRRWPPWRRGWPGGSRSRNRR